MPKLVVQVVTKTAKKYPVAWDLVCPGCSESLPSPSSGGFFWTEEDIQCHAPTVKCRCGAGIKLPKRTS
jgi:hypothetical protein